MQPTKADQAHRQEDTAAQSGSGNEADDAGARFGDAALRRHQEQRPFYQIYLCSTDPPAGEQRGEHRVRLIHAPVRACAALLEMLCVPLGRSGNPTECYLLYEDKSEFEAAVRLAPMLDVPAAADSASPAGPDEALRDGIGLMLSIVDRGAIVEKIAIDKAEKRLAEAIVSEGLSVHQRWAAAILAGRLMSEYRYDNAAARSYLAQSERIAPPGSLEQYTSMYWRAEVLVHEGRSGDAGDLYRLILDRYGPKVTNSQLVHQARLSLRQKRGR